jgi:hypothetical protein
VPKPVAIWNSARDVWETPQTEGLFCEHLDVYSETFPTSGMTVNGAAYELPTWEPRTGDTGSLSLLPTVTASEATGAGSGPAKTGGDNLRTAVTLLPSPRASEGEKGGPNMRGSKGDLMLSSAVHRLLPTPTVGMTQGGNKARSGARSGELLLNGVAEAISTGANTSPLYVAGKPCEEPPLPLQN